MGFLIFQRCKTVVNENPHDPLPSLSSKAMWRHGAVIYHVGSGRAEHLFPKPVGHKRTPAKAPGQAAAAAHRQQRWDRMRHKPLGFCPVQKSLTHCRRITDRSGIAVFLDYYLFVSGGLGSRIWRKPNLVLGNGWAARASAAGRTHSVPPSYILQ